MKYLLSSLLLIAVASGVEARELNASEASRALKAEDVASEPSMQGMAKAFAKSRLRGVDVNVLVVHDENGNVLSTEMDRRTGSAALDKAILSWANALKLNVTSAGKIMVPIKMQS